MQLYTVEGTCSMYELIYLNTLKELSSKYLKKEIERVITEDDFTDGLGKFINPVRCIMYNNVHSKNGAICKRLLELGFTPVFEYEGNTPILNNRSKSTKIKKYHTVTVLLLDVVKNDLVPDICK